MEPSLVLQQQPDDKTCVCTSIAIILGIPASVIISQYHERYVKDDWSIRMILSDIGIEFTSFDTADRGGMGEAKTGYYLTAVPSLNFQGGMHEVVCELDGEENLFLVHDPQAGTGKKYYVAGHNGDELAVELSGGYTLEALITKESIETFRASGRHPLDR